MSIHVRVRMVGSLQRAVGLKEIEVLLEDGTRLGDLFVELGELYGSFFVDFQNGERDSASPARVRVLVNGQFSFVLDGANTVLKEGDVVSVMPVISGG